MAREIRRIGDGKGSQLRSLSPGREAAVAYSRTGSVLWVAPAALPVLNLPRLRALALFGRRPPQRVDRPASRQPKTSTTTEVIRSIDYLIGAGDQSCG